MGGTNIARTEPKPLSGCAAIITGAGSGIGRAIAVALAREGMRLVLAGRRDQSLRETARLAGIEAEIVTADLAGKAGVEKLAQAAPSSLRLLVHSAALFLRGPVAATTEADWSTAAMVNVHAPMLLTAACLKALRAGRGDVVFINSAAGRLAAGAETAVYAATKHALRAVAARSARRLTRTAFAWSACFRDARTRRCSASCSSPKVRALLLIGCSRLTTSRRS
jgi:short-subunit dehydrogenase